MGRAHGYCTQPSLATPSRFGAAFCHERGCYRTYPDAPVGGHELEQVMRVGHHGYHQAQEPHLDHVTGQPSAAGAPRYGLARGRIGAGLSGACLLKLLSPTPSQSVSPAIDGGSIWAMRTIIRATRMAWLSVSSPRSSTPDRSSLRSCRPGEIGTLHPSEWFGPNCSLRATPVPSFPSFPSSLPHLTRK